jgi:hypothetical protein
MMLLCCMFASIFKIKNEIVYLHGGLHLFTSKSFLLTSQYIPHYSGRVGTNLNVLHGHALV